MEVVPRINLFVVAVACVYVHIPDSVVLIRNFEMNGTFLKSDSFSARLEIPCFREICQFVIFCIIVP
jgi:hypothetical protein